MTGNIDHKKYLDKVAMTLVVPRTMHEAFFELAGFCGDLLESDHPGVDFAGVEEEVHEATRKFNRNLMAQVAENRDDGARSIRRDGSKAIPMRLVSRWEYSSSVFKWKDNIPRPDRPEYSVIGVSLGVSVSNRLYAGQSFESLHYSCFSKFHC